MRKKILLALLILMMAVPFGYTYTRDWDEADPIDHSKNSTWPGEMREIMVDVSDRLSDMVYGFTSGESTIGIKKLMFGAQGSAPSTSTDQIQIYAKVVSTKTELFMKDEDGNEQQLTSGGKFIGGMSGEIRMWSGTVANIPTGWELADGACTNTCPDLTDKFIVGAKQDDGGVAKTNITGSLTASGGASTHTHPAGTYQNPAHNHGGYTGGVDFNAGIGSLTAHELDWQHYHSIAQQAAATITGSSGDSSALPTYYALCFIIKI